MYYYMPWMADHTSTLTLRISSHRVQGEASLHLVSKHGSVRCFDRSLYVHVHIDMAITLCASVMLFRGCQVRRLAKSCCLTPEETCFDVHERNSTYQISVLLLSWTVSAASICKSPGIDLIAGYVFHGVSHLPTCRRDTHLCATGREKERGSPAALLVSRGCEAIQVGEESI